MYTINLPHTGGSNEAIRPLLLPLASKSPAWIHMTGPCDAPFEAIMKLLQEVAPDVPVFGATSFQGVFSNRGFQREVLLLVAERPDAVTAAVSLQAVGPDQARGASRGACQEIEQQRKRRPTLLLLHATPGFEERILEGIHDAYGDEVPVYGGSAADDSLSGRWRVLANGTVCPQGFVLVGIETMRAPIGSFLGGFLPTEHVGIITKVAGRKVLEIDGQPAAVVYNNWTGGAIKDALQVSKVVTSETALFPVARHVGQKHGMPRRLLSHPHQTFADTQALSFFTEFSVGDEIALMTSAREPLVTRVRGMVARGRSASPFGVRGALLVYCGGSLSVLRDQADKIAQEFAAEVKGAPFAGLATFGEQGTFFTKTESWHGNLMCAAIMF